MKVKSESHEKVKNCSFQPIGMKFGEDNFFCDWLSPRWFLGHLEALLWDLKHEGKIREP